MRIFSTAIALATMTACNPSSSIEGTWVFVVAADPTVERSDGGDENFVEGSFPKDADFNASDWTESTTNESSGQLFVAQIIGGPNKVAWLALEDSLVPGERVDGMWNFVWDEFNETNTERSHPAGYRFEQYDRTSVSTVVTLGFSGAEAVGSLAGVTEQDRSWTETDVWDADAVGQSNSQMPTQQYLVGVPDGQPTPRNDALLQDCDDPECVIAVNEITTTTYELTGLKSDENTADAYDALTSDN